MRKELKFTFRDEDDKGKYYIITNAENSYWALYDLDQELRDIYKYPEKADKLGVDQDSANTIRTILREIMFDKGISFNQVE